MLARYINGIPCVVREGSDMRVCAHWQRVRCVCCGIVHRFVQRRGEARAYASLQEKRARRAGAALKPHSTMSFSSGWPAAALWRAKSASISAMKRSSSAATSSLLGSATARVR